MENIVLSEKNFCGLLVPPKNATPLNFAEKKIVNSQKTLEVAEVFSLESFLLYV